LIIASEIDLISIHDSIFVGSACVFFYGINYLWFKKSAIISDKLDLVKVMEGIREVKVLVEKISLSLNEDESNHKNVDAQLFKVKKRLNDLEKLISPSLLKRL